MEYINCPHYEEMDRLVTNNIWLDNVRFEVDDIRDCEYCSLNNITRNGESCGNICQLWFSLVYCIEMSGNLNIKRKGRSIEDTLKNSNIISKELVMRVVRRKGNKSDNNHEDT